LAGADQKVAGAAGAVTALAATVAAGTKQLGNLQEKVDSEHLKAKDANDEVLRVRDEQIKGQ